MLLLRVTSIDEVINLTAFLPAESALQPEGLLHTRQYLYPIPAKVIRDYRNAGYTISQNPEWDNE